VVADADRGRADAAGGQPDHGLSAARFLLTPGRKYEQAVEAFSPYTETKVVNEVACTAGRTLIAKAVEVSKKRPSFVYVNNRLEGNAPNTIETMLGN